MDKKPFPTDSPLITHRLLDETEQIEHQPPIFPDFVTQETIFYKLNTGICNYGFA